MGKKIIEMKKIENRQALQVTFSKRRKGFFKKAAQLSVLRRCPMLAIAFSPGGKPFSVGVGDNELIENFFSCNFDIGNGVVRGAADFGETQIVAASGDSALMDHDGDGDSDGDDLMNAVATDGEGRFTDDAWMYQFDADNCNSMEQLQHFISRAEEKQSNERSRSNHVPAAVVPLSAIEAHGGYFQAIDNAAVYDAGLPEARGETHAYMHTGFLGETSRLPESRVAPLASISGAGVVFQTYNPDNGIFFDGVGLPEYNGIEADSRMMMQAADPSPLAVDTGSAFFMEDMSSQIDWGAIDAHTPMGGDHDLMNAVATDGEGCSTDGQSNENGVSFDDLEMPESNGREAESRMMIQTAAPSALAVDTRIESFVEDMSSQIGGGAGVVAADTDDWLLDEDFLHQFMS